MQGVISGSLRHPNRFSNAAFHLAASTFLVVVVTVGSVAAQSVVPDGGTATTVNLSPSGQINVGIAPADASSISHNTYTDFSVPASGVTLDNSVVAAGTILNEVTSAKVTTIAGELSVVGPTADVIVANPNGITVNGGRFQNTRNVALTTGTLSRNAAGEVLASVGAGDITIEAGGLSGTMEELALISQSLRVDGPVGFDAIDGASHVNIIAGDGRVSFDASRGGALPWALVTDQGMDASNAILVDITRQGSLSAGRISVAVTDAGAGVRFAGDQMASAGGFRLRSDGRIELSEARIQANGSVNINAGSAELTSSDTRRAEIISDQSGVVLDLKAGNLDLGASRLSGAAIASDNLASSGGVTLLVDGEIRTKTLPSGQGAALNSPGSHVVLTAGGEVAFDGLSIDTAGDFRLAANDVISLEDVQGSVGEDFRVLSDASLSFDASVIAAQSDIRLDAAALRFGAESESQPRTELVATSGGFLAKTRSGDVRNYGSLLQGNVASAGDAESLGGMTLISAGGILNESLSVRRLAVAFGAADDLHVTAGGDIVNRTGRLFSNAAITISTQADIVNETAFTEDTTPYTISRTKGGRLLGSLFLKRSRKLDVFADYGEREIDGEQSFILGVGDVSLQARSIRSIGADITGARVDIVAVDEFTNESRQVGRLKFSQSCKLFCKTSGFSNLRTVGGNVTGSDRVSIAAGQEITSVAGRIDGANGVSITAPVTRFIPILTAAFIDQKGGVGRLVGSRAAFLVSNYEFGALRSPAGTITINGDVVLGGTNVFSGGELIVNGTRIESDISTEQQIIGRQPIGLFWNVF
ncbi:hypothetical protein DDZ14_02800 [Maritimibacter sp. 55A14]|uniref:filamentous hemagglutinin N-terminal domain-containing protein n=1 Tax=Maritimibacter sp. 55A14 TaxID=2174844 RepID=UPI000D61D6FC|nr:filamentous hemagglutinin N-terminal domain-containing protein [Maritimibacter sp. 55A14]PWE34101.1 hypothetical protein DDZ14_02800 [Maritimibacter sp. 55A14]